MWRDGRKYQCFLHVLAQTVSELPAGILSSCNNGFFGQTKNDRDRAAILAHIARNTKGFVNSEYDRFIARMPIGMAVAKLGYTQDILEMEPYLIRSLMLAVAEPTTGRSSIITRRLALFLRLWIIETINWRLIHEKILDHHYRSGAAGWWADPIPADLVRPAHHNSGSPAGFGRPGRA